MKKLLLILFVAIIVIIAFPKSAGQSGGGMPSPEGIDSYVDKNCSCLGYKYNSNPDSADVPREYKCIGIPHSCSCVKQTINRDEEADNVKSEVVTCE